MLVKVGEEYRKVETQKEVRIREKMEISTGNVKNSNILDKIANFLKDIFK